MKLERLMIVLITFGYNNDNFQQQC